MSDVPLIDECLIDECSEQAVPLEASDPDPYGGVALGVECAWPAAEGWAA